MFENESKKLNLTKIKKIIEINNSAKKKEKQNKWIDQQHSLKSRQSQSQFRVSELVSKFIQRIKVLFF